MSFEIITSDYFDTEAKALAKRYKSFKKDLIEFRKELEKTPLQGSEIAPNIRKIRMAIATKGRGKSGGARIITYNALVTEQEGKVYLLLIQRVQIDGESLESAEKHLKNVLADFEQQGNRMKNGGYVDKRVSFYSILCAVISLLFACLMCYLWVDAAKDRDNYKRYYEYYQQQMNEDTTIK